MRSGITTGTCATAAAIAAASLLAAQGRGETPSAPEHVEVALPAGEVVCVPVAQAEVLAPGVARASVVKDAGDDPDITNGMTVAVEVALGGECVRFAAGEGVGTVTCAGLQLAVGESAINPVPRAMISSALEGVLGEGVGAVVTVSVIGGEEVARKTFNPRLGIEGGISIIGTTGRVEPKSSEAWMRSLLPQVDVALAAGHTTVWLAPGGIGEEFAVEVLHAPAQAVVQCSNFVGELLDACGRAGVERVVLVGHAGKLVKVAAGLFDTHSRAGDARLETVAAIAAAEGAPGPLVARLLALPTVQAAVAELDAAGLSGTWDAIAARAAARATQRAGVPVEVVLLGYGGQALGATAGAGVDRVVPEPGALAIVGTGPGAEDLITPAAWRTIRTADVVVGGVRLLDAFAPDGVERVMIGSDAVEPLARAAEALASGRHVVVLASGDPAFFGILATVRRELPEVAVRVVPGISSGQLALARLGLSWEGTAIASAHGRESVSALATCESSECTLVLMDRATPPQAFASALDELGDFEVTVLERVGYPEERIATGSAAEIAAGQFDALSVLYVRKL